jgi:hypothetical protein
MPTVTTILMAAGTAFQAINAMNEKAKAQKALDVSSQNAMRINNQQTNQLKSLTVPTLGTQVAQQNLQSQQAGTLQSLKEGGASTLLGGIPLLGEQSREQNLALAARTDEMQYQRDMSVKQQDQAIADAKINRAYDLEMQRMGGAQTAIAANESTLNQSLGSAAQFMGDIDAMKIYKGQDPLKITDIFKAKINT